METAAVLAAGLPADSRCIKKLSECRYSIEIQLMALIADLLNIQIWQYSGGKALKPESILARMNSKQDNNEGYDTPEEFETALARARGQINGL